MIFAKEAPHEWQCLGVSFGNPKMYGNWNSKMMIEGSLEVKLPTIWTDGKAEVGTVREEKRRSKEI